MVREMVGIREAVRGWDVSERALRRRLTAGEVGSSERAADGSWLVASEWLDDEFERTVIDLRDPVVSDGLAAVLNELRGVTEQIKVAEVRAAVAEAEVDNAAVKIRAVNDQLENEQAEHRRLQFDFSQLQRDYAVQAERLEQSEAEAERAWSTWEKTETEALQRQAADEALITRLTRQLERSNQKVRLAESMTSRRKRRVYDRLAAQLDKSVS